MTFKACRRAIKFGDHLNEAWRLSRVVQDSTEAEAGRLMIGKMLREMTWNIQKKYNTRKTAVFHAVKMQHKVKHMAGVEAGVEQGGADLSCQLMSACCKCLLQIPPFTQIIVAWLRI